MHLSNETHFKHNYLDENKTAKVGPRSFIEFYLKTIAAIVLLLLETNAVFADLSKGYKVGH